VIATFGDLEVPDVRTIPQVLPDAGVRGHRIVDQAARREFRSELVEVREAEEQIHLGDLAPEVVLVALDEAADRDHGLDASVPLEGRRLEHRVDRLALGGVDEAAC
jgi:hypothetical protein